MKKFYFIFSFLILLCMTLWLASPYWMLYQINQAIEQNQAEKISKYIDYTRVQASLEPQIQSKITQAIGLENKHTWLGSWGNRVTESLSQRVVHALVNPQSIAILMQGKALKDAIDLPDLVPKTFNQSLSSYLFSDIQAKNLLPKYTAVEPIQHSPQKIKATYVSINTFQVIVPTIMSGKTEFIFQRQYWNWKLTAIYLH